MRVMRLVLLGVSLTALAGCAVFKAPEPETPPAPTEVEEIRQPRTELDRLLNYFQRIRKLAGAELGREHDSARLAYTRTRSDFDRLRLAMVLSLPNTGFNNDMRALELLEPMVRNQNSNLHGLAFLMSAFVQEQRRLGGSVQGMRQKLDALKSLERSLIEREQAGQRPR